MNFYEMVYIARSDLTQAQINTLNSDLSAVVTDNGGKVSKTEYWGIKNLAYKIKKRNKGHFCLLNIEAIPTTIKLIHEKTKHNEAILRLLITKVDELENEPSIMMSKQSNKFDKKDGFKKDNIPNKENTETAQKVDSAENSNDSEQ